jgi:hypothetical protein
MIKLGSEGQSDELSGVYCQVHGFRIRLLLIGHVIPLRELQFIHLEIRIPDAQGSWSILLGALLIINDSL